MPDETLEDLLHAVIYAISQRMLAARGGDVEAAVRTSLGELCGAIGRDIGRMYLIEEGPHPPVLIATGLATGHEPGEVHPGLVLEPTPDETAAVHDLLARGGVVQVRALEVPDDDLLKARLRSLEVADLLVVPLRRGGHLSGGLAFRAKTELPPLSKASQALLRVAGEVLAVACERARAEADLLESQTRLRLLADATSEGILVHDGQRALMVNRALRVMVGLPEGTMPSAPDISRFVAPESREYVSERIRSGFQGTYRTFIRHQDGASIPVEVETRQEQFGGRVVRVVAIRDIRERLTTERRLREGEERFRSLVERTWDGVVLSRHGRIVEADAGAAALLGAPPEELRGQDLEALLLPVGTADDAAGPPMPAGGPSEARGRRPDGSTFPVLVLDHDTDLDGRPVRFTFLRDLTRQREVEGEHRRFQGRLQRAQKLHSLGVMAGGIAHDFNNLLASIVGNAELACMELPAESSCARPLERIRKTAARAADLTQLMLAYSGHSRVAREPLDVEDLVVALVPTLDASRARRSRLHFAFAEEPLVVEADPAQLRQVVLNLAKNAAEALGDQPGTVWLRTRRERISRPCLRGMPGGEELPPGEFAVIEVADDGPGMDEVTLARIFDPYFSMRASSRGLGLVAVLGIVRSHRGAIDVTSEPGAGTTVRVLLPASKAVGPGQAAAGAADDWRGTGTVLVVDDDADVREVARNMLHRAGLEVMLAEDGQVAVELYRREGSRVDLVLLDLLMPRPDGRETLGQLLAMDPTVRVLFTSGYNEPTDIFGACMDLAAGFLRKPYRYSELVAAVRAALEGN